MKNYKDIKKEIFEELNDPIRGLKEYSNKNKTRYNI